MTEVIWNAAWFFIGAFCGVFAQACWNGRDVNETWWIPIVPLALAIGVLLSIVIWG
jgi:hypothetical protein